MPGGDRTGPLGQGPMTGGGFGFCGGLTPRYGRFQGNRFAGNRVDFNPGRGRGGRGVNLRKKRCWSQDMDYPGDNDNEAPQLQNEAQFLEASLTHIKKRLSELEKQEIKKEG